MMSTCPYDIPGAFDQPRVVHDSALALAIEVARLVDAQMITDTYNMRNTTFTVTGLVDALVPKLVSRLESDGALQSALVNAIWPTLLSRMVIYFRNNPPKAAPSSASPL